MMTLPAPTIAYASRAGLGIDVIPVRPDVYRDSSTHPNVLSMSERHRLSRLRHSDDRAAYLISHVRLRMLLAHRLGIPADRVTFGRFPCPRCGEPAGRPRTEPFHGLEFSMSHTRGLVAIATASVPVGVDVQRRPERVARTLLHGLHPDEATSLTIASSQDRAARYTRCWVRKEAVLKAEGVGLGHGTTTPAVGVDPVPAPVEGWRLHDLPDPPGFAGAVAVSEDTDELDRGVRP